MITTRIAFVFALLAFGSLTTALTAQRATATQHANVRSGPSKQHVVVTTLAAGDSVDLVVATQRNGWYHIELADGTTGWVYGKYIAVAGAPVPVPPPAPNNAVATAVDSTWDKPAPQSSTFHRTGFPNCGPTGDAGDAPTNLRKNRTDEPTLYHAVAFAAITGLPYPINHKRERSSWNQTDLDVIAPYEGVAVSVTGFIAQHRGVIVEDLQNSSNGESTNCHATDDPGVDWHVTIVPHPGDPKSAGIVVEPTPRVRAHGHPWTPNMLTATVATGDSVRVSGWLMYDPEHFAQATNYDPAQPSNATPVRATLWEIHPVTRLEVFDHQTGQWRVIP